MAKEKEVKMTASGTEAPNIDTEQTEAQPQNSGDGTAPDSGAGDPGDEQTNSDTADNNSGQNESEGTSSTERGDEKAKEEAERIAEKAKAKRTPQKETVKATEPKVSDALIKAGQALLKSNPNMDVVYMTSDGLGFYAKNDAENHARNFKDKAVTPVKRN